MTEISHFVPDGKGTSIFSLSPNSLTVHRENKKAAIKRKQLSPVADNEVNQVPAKHSCRLAFACIIYGPTK
ncbi:hypothetical protein [Noviherbaspirillum soli]|uniref:hypothetical protein n=1 Tax=Noviherbaspirillum soli TaxID=1064518 RepID=UPI00188BCAA9|nr:hypothetical protein [Noviherbaspirillum soli]